MEKLIIPETKSTPSIEINPEKNCFEIKGRSYPENSKEIYTPIVDFLENNKNSLPQAINFIFNLYYISSSSIISIKQILLKLQEFCDNKHIIKIIWCYDEDDEDIKKIGEDYSKIINLEFKLKENKE